MNALIFPPARADILVQASGLGPSSTAALMKPAEFRTSTASRTLQHATQNALQMLPIDGTG